MALLSAATNASVQNTRLNLTLRSGHFLFWYYQFKFWSGTIQIAMIGDSSLPSGT